MKSKLISNISLTLGLVLLVSGVRAEPSPAKRPDLKSLDKNGDKAISEEEAGPKIWARLGQLDKNGDGKVAGDEFRRSKAGQSAGGKGKPGEFMKRLDKNGDGNIAKAEAGQLWQRLSKLDKNEDDLITKDEFAGAAKPGSGGDFFTRLDKNKDGKLVESEVPRGWEKLSKADSDGDNAITKEEMTAARAAMSSMKTRPSKSKSPSGGTSAIFGKYDEDNNGKLDAEEVPAEMWAKLSRADDNADGLVSKAELAQVYAQRAGNSSTKKRPEME